MAVKGLPVGHLKTDRCTQILGTDQTDHQLTIEQDEIKTSQISSIKENKYNVTYEHTINCEFIGNAKYVHNTAYNIGSGIDVRTGRAGFWNTS